jgi:hypothetical protein
MAIMDRPGLLSAHSENMSYDDFMASVLAMSWFGEIASAINIPIATNSSILTGGNDTSRLPLI